MIVVDNDVISYFWLRMDVERSALARKVRRRDDDWVTPELFPNTAVLLEDFVDQA
jgi:hypothetical protein